MLCKLYGGEDIEVRQASWKSKSAPAANATAGLRRDSRGGSESEQLLDRIDELNAELALRTKEAFEQGMKAGDAAVRKNLEEQLRVAAESLAKAAVETASMRAVVLRRAEADTVRLALEVARRVLHREVSIDPSALADLIRAALEKLRGQDVYRVRIHPGQEKLMRSCLEQAGRAAIEVVADVSLPSGGALFEISRGALDASVETQLREIENGLIDQMEIRG